LLSFLAFNGQLFVLDLHIPGALLVHDILLCKFLQVPPFVTVLLLCNGVVLHQCLYLFDDGAVALSKEEGLVLNVVYFFAGVY
jgi:hypothetical protein